MTVPITLREARALVAGSEKKEVERKTREGRLYQRICEKIREHATKGKEGIHVNTIESYWLRRKLISARFNLHNSGNGTTWIFWG